MSLKFMSFKEEIKNMSNEELINEIREHSCDSYCGGFWDIATDELEVRLGVKAGEIEEAIRYFRHGIDCDIFSEEMIKIAKISIEALERMKSEL